MPDDFRTLIHHSADDAPAPSGDLTQRSLDRRVRYQRRRRLLRGSAVAGGALAVGGIAVTLALALPGDPDPDGPPASQPGTSGAATTTAPPAAECVPQLRVEDGTVYSAELMLEQGQLDAELVRHGEAVLGACIDTNEGEAGIDFGQGTPVETLRIEGIPPAAALAVQDGPLSVVYLSDKLTRAEQEQLAGQLTQ